MLWAAPSTSLSARRAPKDVEVTTAQGLAASSNFEGPRRPGQFEVRFACATAQLAKTKKGGRLDKTSKTMNRSIAFVLTVLTLNLNVSAQDWAKARLEKSPRHLEWVKIKQGARELNCSIAYPEVKDKAAAVLVIHEIFGLTDWVRSVTDQLAEAGYIAIAPDLLSGMAPGGGGSAELGGPDGVRKVISSLPADQITADLNAVADYVAKLPACNGKVTVAGFCWGGGQTFRFATNRKEIAAAYSFYGPMPDSEADIARIN